jgi:hypothetical protein
VRTSRWCECTHSEWCTGPPRWRRCSIIKQCCRLASPSPPPNMRLTACMLRLCDRRTKALEQERCCCDSGFKVKLPSRAYHVPSTGLLIVRRHVRRSNHSSGGIDRQTGWCFSHDDQLHAQQQGSTVALRNLKHKFCRRAPVWRGHDDAIRFHSIDRRRAAGVKNEYAMPFLRDAMQF